MRTLRLPMRTSPGPQPSRSPNTSKYMYSPACCRSLGRVKLRHFSKMSFDALPFFLPVMSLVDKRIVLNSIHKFGKSCTALPPSPQGAIHQYIIFQHPGHFACFVAQLPGIADERGIKPRRQTGGTVL